MEAGIQLNLPRQGRRTDSLESEMANLERAAFSRSTLNATAPRRPVALVELIATAALALSTVVAATAVSIGIARADVFGTRADGDTAPLAIALLIGLLLSVMGGFTAIMAERPKGKA
jgi:glycerol uptake facilitator-like aquaporin